MHLDFVTNVKNLWHKILPLSVRSIIGKRIHPIILEYTRKVLAARRPSNGVGPLAIVGMFSGYSGIAQSAQLASRALDRLCIQHKIIDIGNPAKPNLPNDFSASAWIFYLNPPELLALLFHWGPQRLRGPLYGYWAWELPVAPQSWIRTASIMDGVLVPSRYTAEAFKGSKAPVTAVPHPMLGEDFAGLRRHRRKNASDPFRVVSLFDFNSSLARKNPFGALEAFRRAFGDDPKTRLVLKTHGEQKEPALAQALRAHAGTNVEIIDAIWGRREVLEFIAEADALISLHRAEGFGLTLAEAMMLGTPLIATAWSGNLDFMTLDTACLVPAGRVAVEDAQGIYRGQIWAEPDIAIAVQHLRRLREDPIFAGLQADRASISVAQNLSPDAWLNTWSSDLRSTLAAC